MKKPVDVEILLLWHLLHSVRADTLKLLDHGSLAVHHEIFWNHDIDCILPRCSSTCMTCTLPIIFWHMSEFPCLNQDFGKKKLKILFRFSSIRQTIENRLTCRHCTLPMVGSACRGCKLPILYMYTVFPVNRLQGRFALYMFEQLY